MKIFFFSEVGKYLPGKVWVAVGRIMLYSKMGVENQLVKQLVLSAL